MAEFDYLGSVEQDLINNANEALTKLDQHIKSLKLKYCGGCCEALEDVLVVENRLRRAYKMLELPKEKG